jgi:hypothetical protein
MLSMFETEKGPRASRWPRGFDARLTERFIEDYLPEVEEEAATDAGPTIRIGHRVFFEWAGSTSWGRVVGIGGTVEHDGTYIVTVSREGGTLRDDGDA